MDILRLGKHVLLVRVCEEAVWLASSMTCFALFIANLSFLYRGDPVSAYGLGLGLGFCAWLTVFVLARRGDEAWEEQQDHLRSIRSLRPSRRVARAQAQAWRALLWFVWPLGLAILIGKLLLPVLRLAPRPAKDVLPSGGPFL